MSCAGADRCFIAFIDVPVELLARRQISVFSQQLLQGVIRAEQLKHALTVNSYKNPLTEDDSKSPASIH